jgi:hypothetical protein
MVPQDIVVRLELTGWGDATFVAFIATASCWIPAVPEEVGLPEGPP